LKSFTTEDTEGTEKRKRRGRIFFFDECGIYYVMARPSVGALDGI
jgi:hypothetical protein